MHQSPLEPYMHFRGHNTRNTRYNCQASQSHMGSIIWPQEMSISIFTFLRLIKVPQYTMFLLTISIEVVVDHDYPEVTQTYIGSIIWPQGMSVPNFTFLTLIKVPQDIMFLLAISIGVVVDQD